MSYDLKVERLLDATPEEAFDAFIDGDAMKDWYQIEPSWDVELVKAEPNVGGTTVIRFGNSEQGWECREDLTYRELDRPNRIVFGMTFATSAMSYDTVVTVTFEEQGGKTLLTLSETGYPTAEERDAHQNGWPSFLAKLDEVIALRR